MSTNSASALGFGSLLVDGGTLSLAANLNNSGGTLNGGQLNTTAAVTNAVPFTIGANGGTISVNSANQLYFHTANTLLGSGPLTLTGTGALVTPVTGVGNLRVDVTNSYSGNLTIQNGGIFEYGVAGAISSSATVALGNQGEINVDSGIALPNTVTVSGGTNSVLGFGSYPSGNGGTYSGTINLNANGTVVLENWYNMGALNGWITGQINGAGGLYISSGSTLGGLLTVVGSANGYSGNTTISNATLMNNLSTSVPGTISPFGSGLITVTSGGTLRRAIPPAATTITLPGSLARTR